MTETWFRHWYRSKLFSNLNVPHFFLINMVFVLKNLKLNSLSVSLVLGAHFRWKICPIFLVQNDKFKYINQRYQTNPCFLQLSQNMAANCFFTFVFFTVLTWIYLFCIKNCLFWWSEQFSAQKSKFSKALEKLLGWI